jgi:DNA-binding LacI/PurR family transcriptional regulator
MDGDGPSPMLDKLSVFMYIDQSEGEMGTKTAELILEAMKGALPPCKIVQEPALVAKQTTSALSK